jgi:hypothetical protein
MNSSARRDLRERHEGVGAPRTRLVLARREQERAVHSFGAIELTLAEGYVRQKLSDSRVCGIDS